MLLKVSVFLFIIQITTTKLIRVNNKNDLKKELKSHANILILFFDNERSSTFKLFESLSMKENTIAKIVVIDCKENKKLCKHYKVESKSDVIQHFNKGKFNKVYDRKLRIESLVRFLEDPTGDIPWEEDETAKDIVHANSAQDLQKLVQGYKKNVPPLMLMFYAPWCGYCKKMKPDFAAAASSLKSRAIFVGINGDLTTTEELKQAFNVSGYPSVFLVQEGNKIYKFSGDNSKDSLIKFVENPFEAAPPKDVPWSEETSEIEFLTDGNFDEFVSTHESVLVMFYAPWCGHCKSLKPELIKAAKQLTKDNAPGRVAAVDSTEQKNVSSLFNVTGYPAVKYFKEGQFQYDVSERTSEGLVKFMLDPQKPKEPEKQVTWNEEESAVHHPRTQEFRPTIKRYKHSLVMFYAPWCGHCKKSKPGFTAAANKMIDNEKVAFIAVDCTNPEYSDVCKSEGIEGFPTIRYYNYGKITSYSDYSLEREQDDFIAFMTNPTNPKLDARRHWKDIAGNDAIVILDTDSFVQNVVSQPSGALIMFYAPWCGHCNAMKPAYVAAAMALKRSLPSCVLGAVDATVESNLAAQYQISGFPTLIYFSPSGDWSKFSGERNEKNIIDFMLKKDKDLKLAADEKKREEKENHERELRKELEEKERKQKDFEEKERKRQEVERKEKEDMEAIETQRKEREQKELEAKKREREEMEIKAKEERELKEKERQEIERKEKDDQERQERERKEMEARERERQEIERKEKEDMEVIETQRKEREQKERIQKELEEKERQEIERKEEEDRERIERERQEMEARERKQNEELKAKVEDEPRSEESQQEAKIMEHLIKIDSLEEFRSNLKVARLCLVYFHKANKKSHIRQKVVKFLEKQGRGAEVRSLDVDCSSLGDVCDDTEVAHFPSIVAFTDGRRVGSIDDNVNEEELQRLVHSALRDEL